jgi:hypothetical protein
MTVVSFSPLLLPLQEVSAMNAATMIAAVNINRFIM